MQSPISVPTFSRHDLHMALIISRREMRDSFRDWRIVVPIFLLTIGFPALMNFTVQQMLGYASRYGSEIVAERLIPLLLMIVGFFPTSFSLVIALETFVGEKERRTLEPLLATPLTNRQLYLGKMLSSLVPPLLASYLGITVYLVSLVVRIDYVVSLELLVQVLMLTSVQALIMVAGAVIVSSQTTSTRAANLLASFIIVPMTLLIQAEAAAFFWGNYSGLWWLLLALSLTAVVLVRMGIHLFNREELLGRELDQIRLGWIGREFWRQFSGRLEDGRYPHPLQWLRETPRLLPKLGLPASFLVVTIAGGLWFGALMAGRYPMPEIVAGVLTGEQSTESLLRVQIIAATLPLRIFFHNVRVLFLAAVLGLFTFGVLGLLVFALPWTLLGFLAAQLGGVGENPLTFLLAAVVPHGILEIPALILAAAAALRWHTVIIAPPPGQTVSQSWIKAAADYLRLLLVFVAPLLMLAALLEAYLTPRVLLAVYGG